VKNKHEKLTISLIGFILCANYLGGFRGKEIVRISLGYIRTYWMEGINHPTIPLIPIIFSARFISETGEKSYCHLIIFKSKSGISLRIWSEKTITAYETLGVTTGSMYRKIVNGKVKKVICGD